MTQGVRPRQPWLSVAYFFSAEKVQRHVWLIANDPTVVRHRRKRKTGGLREVHYATIIERTVEVPERQDRRVHRNSGVAPTLGRRARSIPPGLIRRTTNVIPPRWTNSNSAFLQSRALSSGASKRFRMTATCSLFIRTQTLKTSSQKIKKQLFGISLPSVMDWEKRFEDQAIGAGKDKRSP